MNCLTPAIELAKMASVSAIAWKQPVKNACLKSLHLLVKIIKTIFMIARKDTAAASNVFMIYLPITVSL